MSRRLPRWARWLLALLLVLLALYLVFYTALTSTAFSRFVLDRVESAVPALAFSRVEGSLTQGLQFDLDYAAAGNQLSVDRARLVFRPGCLWRKTLCIEKLHIDTLRASLSLEADPQTHRTADETDLVDIALPDIALPVNIFLESLTIGSLIVEQDNAPVYQLKNLQSALTWRNHTLEIRHLNANDRYCHWSLEGGISFIDNYPLEAEVGCESVLDFGQDGHGHATVSLSGDLAQLTAQLDARIASGYTAEPATLHADIKLAPLEAELPIELEATTREAIRLVLDEQSVQLNSVLLVANGPLSSPAIAAQLQFENSLWPGENSLYLQAAATPEQLTVESVTLQLPQGRVRANGKLTYAEALAWNGELTWQNIDLAQFAAGLTGELSGESSSQISYRAGDLRAQVNLQTVSGTWLEKRLMASGRFDWQNDALTVDDFRLRQGDNRLSLAGRFAPAGSLDLAIQLNLPRVGDLIPATWAPLTSGEVHGTVELAGTVDNITVNSTLNVRDVQYSDMRLARGELQLQWFGLNRDAGQIQLTLERLAVAEDLVGDVRLSGQGNIDQQVLQLQVSGLRQHRDKSAQLQCKGGFVDGRSSATPLAHWQGSCGQLALSFALNDQAQTWRLAAPLALEVRPHLPAFTASAFCLTHQAASLCSREMIRFNQDNLSTVVATGDQLPADWIQAVLPNVAVEGRWQFRLVGDQLLANPQLTADVSTENVVVRWQAAARAPIALHVTRLSLNGQWRERQQQLRWELQTEKSGASRGELHIEDRQISGSLDLERVQLGDYSHFFLPGPEDELAGRIDAELSLSGTLQQPVLAGRLSLDNGLFDTDVLPVPLRDIQLVLNVKDNRASADGRFYAADSVGEIGGEFLWEQGTWSGKLTVQAEPLVLEPQPGMRVHVAPDLAFTFSPRKVSISGQVRVPEASIEITELPEQAVSVSADAVIVGEQETESPVAITTNLKLSLGDKVYFEGFGLETRITGNLTLQQSGGELLKANGQLQLVEGRYQAYGQDLVIRSGDLVFVGDIDNPQVRLEAVRADTANDVLVGLRASGSARDPRIILFSRPDMPQQAQLSYLLTGNPPGTSVEVDPQLAAAEAALSYALESGVGTGITRRAGDVLGIEDLQVTAGATDAGTQIGLSGYITPNLLVRYGVGVFEAINTLTLRYQMSKNLYLEAISGEGNDFGIMWSFERD
jgi:translocation and assembly module TamB